MSTVRRGRAAALVLAVSITLGLLAVDALGWEQPCEGCLYRVIQVCDCYAGMGMPPQARSELQQWINIHFPGNTTPEDCNDDTNDRYWAHSFDVASPANGLEIQGAFLCAFVTTGHYNDHLKIGVIEDPNLGWSWDNGLYNQRLTSIGFGLGTTDFVMLDLSNLYHPNGTLNLIPKMQQFGVLDVTVEDDSQVHYMTLILLVGVSPQQGY